MSTPLAPAANGPQDVDVVAHTHWDREWYLPRETTLLRLQAVMAQVLDALDSGALPSFLFDGQTVAVEDLLATAPPEMAQRLRRHAEAGRLILGPWYVSADEFLVSGESLIRNLAFGLADAARLGPAQRLGYLPDTFGHVAQMPQVLAQFGIEQAVLWRGADATRDRFDWVAPDGTVARTVFLTAGYYLIPLHGPQDPERLLALLRQLAARRDPQVGGPLLLPHGGDHLAPAENLAQRLHAFNQAQGDFRLRWSTLQAHADEVLARGAACETLHGELRHNTQAFVLPDVLSTRRPLKQAHQQAEDRLLGEIEPLWAQAAPHAPAPAGLERAWRTLIQQQAHDSICGCSIDAVHAEMAQRFVNLSQLLDGLREQALQAAGLRTAHQHGPSAQDIWADDSRCTLFNPLPVQRQGWHTLQVFLKGARHESLRISLADGQPLPCEVLAVQEARELVSPLDDFPEPLVGHRYEIALQACVPGLGALPLRVESASPAGPAPHDNIAAGPGPVMENAAWRVELTAHGCLELTDRLLGHRVERAFSLRSELDAGDSYNFSPPPAPAAPAAPAVCDEARWALMEQRRVGAVQEMTLRLELDLPAGLDPARQGADPRRVTSHGELRLRLLGDEPALDVRLHWHNAACDQRTRLLLPGLPADLASTWSDTAFAWTERPIRLAQIPDAPSKQEMPVAVQPSLSAVVAGPWAVVHRALHEHEIVSAPATSAGQEGATTERALGLTLVRSVGWLSRRDLRTRGVGAGPDLATPEAQCLGPSVAELQLLAGAAARTQQLPALATHFRRPLLLLRGQGEAWAPTVDLGQSEAVTSSVRRDVDGRLELRLWNPGSVPVPLDLELTQWEAVQADGQPDPRALPVGRRHVLRPFGLLTLRQRGEGAA
ncbi:MAG: hypothetical protein WCT47_14950 [Betaproteobacteria bacterium]